MLYYKTINSKGQIVIPAAIRRSLGVKAGDTLLLTSRRGRLKLTPVHGRRKIGTRAKDKGEG